MHTQKHAHKCEFSNVQVMINGSVLLVRRCTKLFWSFSPCMCVDERQDSVGYEGSKAEAEANGRFEWEVLESGITFRDDKAIQFG
jgi:hypothetical protein